MAPFFNQNKEIKGEYSSLKEVYQLINEKGFLVSGSSFPVSAGKIRIFKPEFLSTHSYFLLESDQKIISNVSFRYLLFLPKNGVNDKCLIIGHGFNESSYIKLVPWAYLICKFQNLPVILFPLSFHINRRGIIWQKDVISSFRKRREIPGNTHFSPFNAVESKRISENPERFFRGCCQSYCDLFSLVNMITEGRFDLIDSEGIIRPFSPDTNIYFLGYSISGYLHLVLIAIHGRGLLKNGKCLLFLSGASGYDMDPVSPLVVDREAFLKAGAFYVEKYKREGSKDFLHWFLDTEIGFWFREIFLQEMGSSYLKRSLKELKGRVFLITDPEDKVFPLKGIEKNLGFIPSHLLHLGRHEFPFNLDKIEDKTYRQLHDKIMESYRPLHSYENVFEEFIETVRFFLGP